MDLARSGLPTLHAPAVHFLVIAAFPYLR